MRSATYAAVLTAALLLATPSIAQACSCATVSMLAGANTADAVFVGTVESVDIPVLLREPVVGLVDGPGRVLFALEPEVRTRFVVEQRFRGPLGETVEINSGDGFCCNCTPGALFSPGERWLITANAYEGELHASICGLAVKESDDPRWREALAAAGPGKSTPHPSPRWVPRPSRWWWLLVGSPLLVLIHQLRRRTARSES